jgi:surfeit locus 1 family protein
MRVTNKWWFLIVVIPVIALCVQAGLWQLDRANQKKILISTLDVSGRILTRASDLIIERIDMKAHRVTFPVRRTDEPLLFLDNRVSDRVVGYDVVGSVKTIEGSMKLWINFGWVPGLSSRAELPSVDLPMDFVLRGQWVPLTDGYQMGEPAKESIGAHVRVQSLKGLLEQNAVEGFFLAEGVLARDATGPMPRSGPEMHYGYALQWFLMAVVLSGLTGWMVRRGFEA